MKENVNSMELTAGNFLQICKKPGETESSVRENEREAFIKYLYPVKMHLYNFIQKASNFSPDADDIFQEALLKGFRYFHSFDRQKSFKTWIFTVAHNLLKDAYQKKQLYNLSVSLEEMGEIPADNTPTGISLANDVQEIYLIAAKLKPRHREVFFLYYYNEFTISEISEITGLTGANIKFILHQARRAIRKVMEVEV